MHPILNEIREDDKIDEAVIHSPKNEPHFDEIPKEKENYRED